MKVAIYTGKVPSPIFIENLIKAISIHKIKIYIYGSNEKDYKYKDENIFLFIRPKNKFKKLVYIIFQFIILAFKSLGDLIMLVGLYKKLNLKQSGGFWNWWSKVLPVIINKPDIFHIQWAKSLGFWFFLKKNFNIKLILSLRGAHINYSPIHNTILKKQYLHLFPKIHNFHAVSKAISNEAEKYGANLKNIKIIHSPVDIMYLQNIKKFSSKNNKIFKFISVGRSHWKKGYHYSLHALKKMILNGYDVTYEIILSNLPSEEILYLISDLNLKNKVKLSLNISQKNIYRKIKSSDCLILPSVEEGIANVVLESMGLSIPIITSDCGGMKEIIKHKENGLVFKSRNIEDLIKNMKTITEMNETKKNDMIKSALHYVKKNHNLSLIGFEMKKLYLKVLNE